MRVIEAISVIKRGEVVVGRFIGRIVKFFKAGKKIASKCQCNLNVLVYRDTNMFIAHCLELDIVAQGITPDDAKRELAESIQDQIQFCVENDTEHVSLFRPAPERFWKILTDLRYRHARAILFRDNITTSDILNNMSVAATHDESFYAHAGQ